MIALRVSEAAALAIVEQAEYYEQASDRSLAARWETAVESAIVSLLNLPQRGASCRFRSSNLQHLRWIGIPGFPKHLIFYRYDESEASLLIVQVMHGARDLASLLDADA